MVFLLGGSGCCGEDNWHLQWVLKTLSLDFGFGVRFDDSGRGMKHLFLHEGWIDIRQDWHLANLLAFPWKALLQWGQSFLHWRMAWLRAFT